MNKTLNKTEAKRQSIKNKEIYDLLQDYRHAPIDNQDEVTKKFHAIIKHFNNELEEHFQARLKEVLPKELKYYNDDFEAGYNLCRKQIKQNTKD